jgi:hypothetical protein
MISLAIRYSIRLNIEKTYGPNSLTPTIASSPTNTMLAMDEHDTPRRQLSVFFDDKALREDTTAFSHEVRVQNLAQCYETILKNVGEDYTRQGEYLLSTEIFFSSLTYLKYNGLDKTHGFSTNRKIVTSHLN